MASVTVLDILTYSGSDKDVSINYLLLGATIIPVLMLTNALRPSSLYLRLAVVPLLLFLFAFQVILCLFVGCVGISIAWSALGGFQCVAEPSLSSRAAASPRLLRASTSMSLVLCGVAWVFYAVTQDALTTAAHVCAAVLGILLAVLFVRMVRRRLDRYTEVHGSTIGAVKEGLLV